MIQNDIINEINIESRNDLELLLQRQFPRLQSRVYNEIKKIIIPIIQKE
jgi:hypothetical protein